MAKLKVFYNENQSTDANTSFSPSARKPGILVKQWVDNNLPVEVVSNFLPVTKEQFYRAHERDHVDAVLGCQKNNGFYNAIPEIAASLPWTSGSMLAAAVHAWKNKTITMSPTSGFHHATKNESMGFCTFNGLMVAALELLEQGAKKIGILDLDHHFGNGTTDIIDWLGADWPSKKEKTFHHYTFGGDERVFHRIIAKGYVASIWKEGDAAERWLKLLPSIVNGFDGCDIVLFQAGADPHVDDPHGGALTNEQFAIRDRLVFEGLTKMKIPVAWNLAGGYQVPLQKVLDIHTITLTECLKVLQASEKNLI
jgi:acetoin utilization deacetylase AcuC-like enzyme